MEDIMISDIKGYIDGAVNAAADRIIASLAQPRLVKGVAAGIARPLGISIPTAYKLYNSGLFDEAVSKHDSRTGRKVILVDVYKVCEIAKRTDITLKINRL